jgi:enterobactin synthetase component D
MGVRHHVFVTRPAPWHDALAVDIAFDLSLDHGRCVGVRIPDAGADLDALVDSALAPEEKTRAGTLPALRRRTWAGGRAAMREVLRRAGLPSPAIFADDRGAPLLPGGVTGSITHKEGLAAALVAVESRARVGIDVELDHARSTDISSRVLAEDEAAELAHLDRDARAREVLLRFSAKEAIYKAIDPFVRRYVAFEEVSVSTHEDGTAAVTPRLKGREGPFAIEVRWLRFDGIVLTTARVTPL